MANTTIPSELIADGAITSAKLDTNIAVGGTLNVSGAFTSLGIDDNATSTAITIDSSENVLVGKSATAFGTAGIEARSGGTLWATASGTNAASFNRLSTDGAIAYFNKDGTPIGSIGTGLSSLAIGKDNTQLMFWDAQSGIFPSNGTTVTDNSIDFGNPNYRFKDLYLSGGVVFNVAGGTGTSTSGKLDDYEEGTWTAGFTGSNNTITAYYTKIGNMVQVIVYSGAISVTAGSNGQITGLPFTVKNDFATATITHNSYAPNSGGNMYLQKNTTHGYVIGANSLNAVTTVSGNLYIMMSATYQTDS